MIAPLCRIMGLWGRQVGWLLVGFADRISGPGGGYRADDDVRPDHRRSGSCRVTGRPGPASRIWHRPRGVALHRTPRHPQRDLPGTR